MLKKFCVNSSLLTILTFAAGSAHAGGYVGASIGQSEFPGDYDHSLSFSVKGGYAVSEHLAFEVAYLNLGSSKDKNENHPTPPWEAEVTGINTSLVLSAPLNQRIDMFAKVGGFFWRVDVSEDGYGNIFSDRGTDISFGVGGAYHVADDISVFAEYQRFDVDSGKIDNFAAGIHLFF